MTVCVGTESPDSSKVFTSFYELEGDTMFLTLLRGKHAADASTNDQDVGPLHGGGIAQAASAHQASQAQGQALGVRVHERSPLLKTLLYQGPLRPSCDRVALQA